MNKLISMMFMAALALPSYAALELVLDSSDGRVYLDSETGDYVIRYVGIEQQPIEVKWAPGNKVDPQVDTNLSVAGVEDRVLYKYKLSNGRSAGQSISFLTIKVPEQTITGLEGPRGWHAAQRESSVNSPDSAQQRITQITWSAHCEDNACIGPGETESLYEYEAQAIPGLTPLYVQGDAPTLIFPDYGPGGEVREFLDEKMPPENNSVRRYVAAPVIHLEGEPEDLLRAIADHVSELSAKSAVSNEIGDRISNELRLAADSIAKGDVAHASRRLGQLRGFIASNAGAAKPESSLPLLREVLFFNLNLIQSKYMTR
jgi:hypothetical protein